MTTTHDKIAALPDDFVPFGDEWRANMMQFSRTHLIDVYRDSCQENQALAAEVERLRKALERLQYYLEECPKDVQPCICNECEAFRIATAALGGEK